jgi:hypothetical protein
MDIDLDLYRHEVRVSTNPLVRLSAIDISPIIPSGLLFLFTGSGDKPRNGITSYKNFHSRTASSHWTCAGTDSLISM